MLRLFLFFFCISLLSLKTNVLKLIKTSVLFSKISIKINRSCVKFNYKINLFFCFFLIYFLMAPNCNSFFFNCRFIKTFNYTCRNSIRELVRTLIGHGYMIEPPDDRLKEVDKSKFFYFFYQSM